MKTKDVIRLLMEADPSGETHVCVGNVDIHYIGRLPAYYDGTLQVLERDESNPHYNITGGKYVRNGDKVQICTLSITDAISNEQKRGEFQVDYSELSEESQVSTRKAHENLRHWHECLNIEMELQQFTKWVEKEATKLTVDIELVDEVAKRFFEKNVSPDDPLPDGGIPLGKSYIDTRHDQWAQKFEVLIDGFLTIRPR